MLNYIWMGMILVAIVSGCLSGSIGEVSNSFISTAEAAVMKVALPLGGMFTLMLGMIRLVEKSGLIAVISRLFRPVLRRLFPEVPPEHPAMGAIMLNVAANFLGAGNASTPFGIRAMQQLETLNPTPGTATRAMNTFLVLNTSALTLISVTGLLLLQKNGSVNPSVVIVPSIVSTFAGLVVGLLVLRMISPAPVPMPPPLKPTAAEPEPTGEPAAVATDGPSGLSLAGVAALIAYGLLLAAGFVLQLRQAAFFDAGQTTGELTGKAMTAFSGVILPGALGFFVLYAALRRVKVFDEFIEGAKEGMQTVWRIIPYLVAMVVGIGVLRASHALDHFASFLRWLHVPGAVPDLAPMMLIRPLSGSGSQGVLANIISTFGADSYQGLAATTMYGSTETTFYVLAVYFGAVGIKRAGLAVTAGLAADATAMATAMALCQFIVPKA